jgi:hypothetical protein
MIFQRFINLDRLIRLKLLRKKVRGVTPIIATILILAMVIAGVVIGFVQIVPYIERSKIETDAASIQSTLIKVDNAIWDMIGDSAGQYIPDSVPSSKLQITIPLGVLETISTRNRVEYEPIYCPAGACATTFSGGVNDVIDNYGVFSHSFSSNYALLPENSLQYLTGSDPYQRRETISYSSITSSISDEQSSSNMSLYRNGFNHYVELSYRPKIFVTQSIENGQPTYNIGLFFIQLQGSSSFSGTTNVFLKYKGTSIKETLLSGVTGDSFSLLTQIDNDALTAYASFTAFPGGFTTFYKVTAITHVFSIT